MVYLKQQWNDNDPTTPLSATRLNHLETQYDTALADVATQAGSPGTAVYAAIDSQFANSAELSAVSTAQFFNYGIRPVVAYNGTSWAARSASIPANYTGSVTYDSADFTGVPSPGDMVANDRWIRQTT